MTQLFLYFRPYIIAVFFLGFASGLPLLLTLSTLSFWLAEQGVDKTTIGLFALVSTPYTFKFLWSPFVDQLSIPGLTKLLGKRRSWMIIAQALLVVSIIALGSLEPSKMAFQAAICALAIAFASATQDIVIDAYRIELLQKDEQGAGAAMYVFGYRVGMLVAGAGALYIAHYASWQMAYTAMAFLVLVGSATIMFVGEPKATTQIKERRVKEWIEHAVIEPFQAFMQRDSWWLILVAIVFYKFGDAFAGVMTSPFYIEMGFTKTEVANITKVFGFVATIVGTFVGGYIVQKMGMLKALIFCGVLQMASNALFIVQAQLGHNIPFLVLTIGGENLASGMGTAAFIAYLSRLCNKEYTATQYALFSSLASFGRTWLSSSSGWFAEKLGWELFFAISIVFAIPGILLFVYFQRKKNIGI